MNPASATAIPISSLGVNIDTEHSNTSIINNSSPQPPRPSPTPRFGLSHLLPDTLSRSGSSSSAVEQLSSEQWIPNEIRLKYNAQRQQWSTQHVLTDVAFLFDGFKLGAHKFILLDGPTHKFFRERLLQDQNEQKGLVVIDIPTPITVDSVNRILSYIYGVPLVELDINQINVNRFLDAGAFFHMEIQLLQQLLNESSLDLSGFVSNNSDRLFSNGEFWDLENEIILKLCKGLNPDTVEDKFLDWIYADKFHRKKDYIKKLAELGQLISNSNHKSKDYLKQEEEGDPDDELRKTDMQLELEGTCSSPLAQPPVTICPVPEDAWTQPDQVENMNQSFHTEAESIRSTGPVSHDDLEIPETVGQPINNNVSHDDLEIAETIEPPIINNVPAITQDKSKNDSSSKSPTSLQDIRKENQDSADSEAKDPSFVPVVEISKSELRKRPNQNLPENYADKRSRISYKEAEKGPEVSCELHMIESYLATGLCNDAFLESWRGLCKTTKIEYPQRPDFFTVRKKFIDYGGLRILIKSSQVILSESKAKELNQILLSIIASFAELKASRSLVFTAKVINYVLGELKKSNNFKNSTIAGEILCYFLDSYGPKGQWTLKTSRGVVTANIHEAITKHWKIDSDRDEYFSCRKSFQSILSLIKSNDFTANLYGLWSLMYYTKTDTNVPKRNEEALKYRSWLVEAKCEDILKDLADRYEYSRIPYFTEILLETVIKPANQTQRSKNKQKTPVCKTLPVPFCASIDK